MDISSTVSALRSSESLPFTDILSPEMLQKYIGNIDYRHRMFTPDLTIFAFLSQVINADQSCQAAVAQVIAHRLSQGGKVPSINTAAYTKARGRLPEEVLSGLAKETGKMLETALPAEWLWRGRPVKLIDGTTVSMPDTAENQAEYPQPDTQKKG